MAERNEGEFGSLGVEDAEKGRGTGKRREQRLSKRETRIRQKKLK